ncbi:MAG: bile acid:sodium symporter [Deltaproteobacteria bacterium]|nr:bile acid:sodium symporter [Deltaproteobacteria bacterium]
MGADLFSSAKKYVDGFTLALLFTVVLALFLPAKGAVYKVLDLSSSLVVASLFFFHGLKLSPDNLWRGLSDLRLHLAVIAVTFILFPLYGLALGPLFKYLTNGTLFEGMMFICVLPSTVQSSIAFTSMAKGDVAAAVCSASFSSLLGVLVTPALVSLIMRAQIGQSLGGAVFDLFIQLILPFALGQALRPWLKNWMERRKKILGVTDRLSILFIVYVSFSHGTNVGVWDLISAPLLLAVLLCCAVLLSLALLTTFLIGRLFGFERARRVVLIFCGSKKSLVTGAPMANVIFTPSMASVIILPLMIFHQLQLVVCSFLARAMSVSPKALEQTD